MNENELNNKLGNHLPEEDFDIPAIESMSAWSRSTDTTAQPEISQADILVVEVSEQASELLRRTYAAHLSGQVTRQALCHLRRWQAGTEFDALTLREHAQHEPGTGGHPDGTQLGQ
jgi:hypothetical protein